MYHCGVYAVRIAAPGRSAVTPERLIAASQLLRTHGVAAVASRGGVHYTECGEEITVWEYVPNNASLPFPARLVGQELRRLHSIPLAHAAAVLGEKVPPLAAAGARGWARVRALESAGLTGGDATGRPGQLSTPFGTIHDAFVAACRASDPVLLHGDLNIGNVLWGVLPGPVLCDFEDLMAGPWAWDLVNVQVTVARGLQPAADLTDLVAGYGANPAACPGWAALCHLRAFNIATWTLTEALAGAGDMTAAWELKAWLNAGFPGLPPLER